MIRLLKPLAAIALTASAVGASAMPFQVYYESQAPGIQSTSVNFNFTGVENFESPTLNTGTGQTLPTTFGGSQVSGIYKDLQVNNADQYGGAGGTGKYAVTFTTTGYSLDLSTTNPLGVNYFGYWLSALDTGNLVSFYHAGVRLFTFAPSDVIAAVTATGHGSQYYYNPNAPYTGQNNQPYIFLNFFAENGLTFDKIVFTEVPASGGYESDNHTVGNFADHGTGTKVPLLNSFVPEPATWAMMLAGFGLIGVASRRRKSTSVTA